MGWLLRNSTRDEQEREREREREKEGGTERKTLDSVVSWLLRNCLWGERGHRYNRAGSCTVQDMSEITRYQRNHEISAKTRENDISETTRKLEGLFSLKRCKRDGSSFELWALKQHSKMSPQVDRKKPPQNLVQILRGGSSYTRFLMREHSKQETPPGGGVSSADPTLIVKSWFWNFMTWFCSCHVQPIPLSKETPPPGGVSCLLCSLILKFHDMILLMSCHVQWDRLGVSFDQSGIGCTWHEQNHQKWFSEKWFSWAKSWEMKEYECIPKTQRIRAYDFDTLMCWGFFRSKWDRLYMTWAKSREMKEYECMWIIYIYIYVYIYYAPMISTHSSQVTRVNTARSLQDANRNAHRESECSSESTLKSWIMQTFNSTFNSN